MAARFHEPFRPGDVVWGPDAFHDDDPYLQRQGTRPWLIVSNDAYPGQGRQYLACALTSNIGAWPGSIPIAPRDWERGGLPLPGRVDTETLFTLKQGWVKTYSGRLAYAKLQQARKAIRSYL